MLDPVLLSRIQFGLTTAFHFIFPPVTIGLSWLIVYLGWRYQRTRNPVDERAATFWLRLFGLLFAVGVASGIALEFQFGTNWSTYSRFVGDIFGSPLAAEGIFAFFLESTFLGILLFGRRRVSPRFYLFSALMVAVGATLSAFWIIVANSWQQTPAGFQIVGEGAFRRAELTDFWAAVFNPSTLPRFTHTMAGCILTGGFFMASISAWYLLRGRNVEFGRRCLRLGLVTVALASLAVLFTGHHHSVQVAMTQPAKMAAFEGLFRTQRGAMLSLWGFPDAETETLRYAVGVPRLLSLLIHMQPQAEVVGLDQFPREEWPPLALSFYPYHVMILLGMYFILVSWAGIVAWRRLATTPIYLRAILYSLPLPWLALELGWLAAEFGRQPWVVYGLLRTREAASPVVPASQIALTIGLFLLIYAALLALTVALVRREVIRGPDEPIGPPGAAPAAIASPEV